MDDATARDAHHVLAASSLTDERIRVLKHGDTFALFDQHGDIRSSQWGESGMYHDGTRFLSRFQLELDGTRPFLLSSTVRDDNDQLVVALTNPDLFREGSPYLPLGSLQLVWRKLLWMGVLYQELRIENHAMTTADFNITMQFAADFADIYEIRGMHRKARGRDLEPEAAGGQIKLPYLGLDGVTRRTALQFTPRPHWLTAGCASYDVNLAPQESTLLQVAVACERDYSSRPALSFDQAHVEVRTDLESRAGRYAKIETENGQFNALVRRATADLHMLTTALPTGPYPYAGIPWFNTPFGRDGLITAMECLWLNPSLARGVLAYLARTQATETIPEQDAEPGKILHETRSGEMAALGEMPFARYYGSVDATPLFIVLAGAYYERTGDRRFIEEIWPNIEAGLGWMERYGDGDGDGFIEYRAHSKDSLLHQGWKDADDAIFHADGSLARGPIALCEVQGYAYAAWQAAATLAAVQRSHLVEEFVDCAEKLRERFDEAFWCEELSLYALALDGDKRPCRVRTSNAGHCLFSGIALPDRAARVAQALHRPESFSGWGIRTLAVAERRYNPMGYHTGSVWPHDNALIAYGMARYGMADEAMKIFSGMFGAATYCDLYRVPELFCGFAREPGEGPVIFPVACAPQAWSAAAVFLILQGCLGLTINALARRITFACPSLPPFLSKVRMSDLAVGNGTADLLIVRHDCDISVNVLHNDEEFDVVVLPVQSARR
jgi:glycogen debranching enzyme